ncbi:hypothetical protein L7F22_061096 [Adiantum nelumboides]|nr:hypothetical protein [Adiantum nelumboides]
MDSMTLRHSWHSCLLHTEIPSKQGHRRTHVLRRGQKNYNFSTRLYKHSPYRLHIQSTLAINTVPELERPLPMAPPHLDGFQVLGGCKLSGHVCISGAKNSALAVLAGSLCCSDDVCLRNVPSLLDVSRMMQVLESLGVHLQHCGSDVYINARNLSFPEPCEESIQKIRAGFLVIGPLVARHGEAILALPGGCAIGSRPVDLHLRGLEALGAKVEVSRQGKVHAWVKDGGRKLKGGSFCMDFPSVGATETLMLAACLAEGKSVLTNAAQGRQTHEMGESSRPPQTEDEIFRAQLVTVVTMFTQVMQNPKFMAFLQTPPQSQPIGTQKQKTEPVKAQTQVVHTPESMETPVHLLETMQSPKPVPNAQEQVAETPVFQTIPVQPATFQQPVVGSNGQGSNL